MINQKNIRNFCIIAHIDHGKSTLADRFLEVTNAVDRRKLTEQTLDSMELEKERGITIKAKAINLVYKKDGQEYILNLIDTPGHVDFTYEVKKSLKASDGVILLVDSSQGVEAQTVANFYLALEDNLNIIPVLNKIDLPSADVKRASSQLEEVFGFKESEIVSVSAKDGRGVEAVLDKVIDELPAPKGDPKNPLKAVLFDTSYDPYRGVILFVRIFEGQINVGDQILLMHTKNTYKVEELGVFVLSQVKKDHLGCGQVGYLYCNIKDPQEVIAGDTITSLENPTKEPVQPCEKSSPMVFCGIFPTTPSDHPLLRVAIEKLKLSDPSFVFEPDNLGTLGHGFRCGFLGLLHMEVIQERLEREFSLDLVLTSPNVLYKMTTTDGKIHDLESPHQMPDPTQIKEIKEPLVKASIVTPLEYMDALCEFSKSRRGVFKKMDYLGKDRLNIEFEIPLAEVVIDYYDKIKSITRGYASLDYDFIGYEKTDVVRIDLLINKKKVDAFAILVNKDRAEFKARAIVDKMKELIHRQMFEISIQAAIGARVIAASKISALRKNVTAKCYGGDVSRKRKLWEKQKKGKKKMKQLGNVEVPSGAFLDVLKM